MPVPFTMSSRSTLGTGFPTYRYASAFLNWRLAASGTGSVRAAATSSPYPSERPLLSCTTAWLRAATSATGTFQVLAAACSSIVRAVAPATRIGS